MSNLKPSLLYISYYFPPIKSIAVKRNYFLAKGLRNYFGDVQVLTTSNYKSLDQEAMPLDGLNVKYLATFDYRTILAKFRRKRSTHFSEEHKKNWCISTLIKCNETFPFNLLLGEGGLLYIWNGLFEGNKYLADKEGKYIITSYRPFANVFVGYLLKNKFKEGVWIINFHDFPIDEIRRNVLFPSFQKWVWKKMLKRANHCITVSQGVENHIKALSSDVHTIMNGVTIRKSTNSANRKFRIVYTGSLYQNLSKPSLLFKVIQELIHTGNFMQEDFEIVYAGKDSYHWVSTIREFGLENVSIDLGELSSEEAMSIQDTANINIILTWASIHQSGVITGKFYEYLGSTNPILAIINGVMDDEIYRLFENLKCGEAVSTENPIGETQVKNFVMYHYLSWKNHTPVASYIAQLHSLKWEDQIKKLSDIILPDGK